MGSFFLSFAWCLVSLRQSSPIRVPSLSTSRMTLCGHKWQWNIGLQLRIILRQMACHEPINVMLRAFSHPDQSDWAVWLPFAEFAINTTQSSKTLLTPFFLVFGRNPYIRRWIFVWICPVQDLCRWRSTWNDCFWLVSWQPIGTVVPVKSFDPIASQRTR